MLLYIPKIPDDKSEVTGLVIPRQEHIDLFKDARHGLKPGGNAHQYPGTVASVDVYRHSSGNDLLSAAICHYRIKPKKGRASKRIGIAPALHLEYEDALYHIIKETMKASFNSNRNLLVDRRVMDRNIKMRKLILRICEELHGKSLRLTSRDHFLICVSRKGLGPDHYSL